VFDLEDLGGVEEQGSIDLILDDVTDLAEDATMTFNINQNGTITEIMRIDGTAGNVGIGTTSPGYKLDVSGDVNFSGRLLEDGVEIFSGMIAPFAAACPTGWTEYTAAQGRYVVGVPDGGTVAGTAGTALTDLENRAVGQHNHAITDPGHVHGAAAAAPHESTEVMRQIQPLIPFPLLLALQSITPAQLPAQTHHIFSFATAKNQPGLTWPSGYQLMKT